MANVFQGDWSRREMMRRVGDMAQLAGAVPFTYREGKAEGLKAIEVRNGSGLRFVILPDRCMDIAFAEIDGVPVAYISKTGLVAPAHYDEPDFLRSFTAGLLTTCGLTYMGAPCQDGDVVLGAHGRIANTPAQDVGIVQEWQGDDYVISVRGVMKEAVVFGENMVLTRTITVRMGENVIHIHDEVENRGFASTPLMLLYHMNFGFPLLSEKTCMQTNCTGLRPRDADAEPGTDRSHLFEMPTQGYREQVFYRDSVEEAYASLHNPDNGLWAQVDFMGSQLPYLVEWKQMGEQEYVVGLEPATYPPDGRAAARARGELLLLEALEKRCFDLKISLGREK